MSLNGQVGVRMGASAKLDQDSVVSAAFEVLNSTGLMA